MHAITQAPTRAAVRSDPAEFVRPARGDDTEFAFALARFACALKLGSLPAHVVEAAKTNIFDTLACAIAGSSAPGFTEALELATEWGGAPQATVLAFGHKMPAHHAAWVNGTMAHARDYDDTHDAAVLHAGVSVMPAALAAAELRGGVSGADFIAGVAAGLETICRLGVATRISIVESGFMYTSLFGHFAATVAAARVLGLDYTQTVNALGIAYSQVAGNHQVTRDGAMTKRMQPGFAAQAALLSVQLARKNVRGVQHTFDGADGFLRVYLRDRCDGDLLRAELGERFEFANLSYKAYPCCRFNHTAIDAVLALRAQTVIDPQRIRSVRVGLNRQAYEAVCTPIAIRKSPQTIVHAQFSIPYTVATALADGCVELRHFTPETIHRADVLQLAQKVDGVVDDAIERDWGRNISPAHLRVEMDDGSIREMRVDYPKGHPDRPMSVADFDAKLRDCIRFAGTALPEDAATQLRAVVSDLANVRDVSELVRSVTLAR
jgi:2-methylcitrate dehydratase PrpD